MYRGLRAGGVLGDDIVPGFPERSMLVKFIEGFRGADQRMPLNSRPLTASEIGLIRRWITEGALNDHAATLCSKLRLPTFSVAPGHPLQIFSKVSGTADLVLSIRDHNNRILHSEEASVKQPPEEMDAGAPGQFLTWTINHESTWPLQVKVELCVRYAPKPVEVLLSAHNGNGSIVNTRKLIQSQCAPD
ncbi:MAG TPA: hypothetical protein VGG97_21550 [Bryobacteraceae bacterium]|jgi:hypothetical protein